MEVPHTVPFVVLGLVCATVVFAVPVGVCIARRRRKAASWPSPPLVGSGGACPWSMPQFSVAIVVLMNTTLTYGLSLWALRFDEPTVSLGATSSIATWLHLCLGFTVLGMLIWLSILDPRATVSKTRSGTEGFVVAAFCKYCDGHVEGRNRKHCWTCNKCCVNFDHHCAYLNQCIAGKNYRPWFTMLWAFLLLTSLQLHWTVNAAMNLQDTDSNLSSQICNDSADGSYPCATVRVSWVLLLFTALIQSILGFFLADLILMHTRFIVMQKMENWSADRSHFFPTFISTYKMLGKNYDDDANLQVLRVAVMFWAARELPSERSVFRLLKERWQISLLRAKLLQKSSSLSDAMMNARGISLGDHWAAMPIADEWAMPMMIPQEGDSDDDGVALVANTFIKTHIAKLESAEDDARFPLEATQFSGLLRQDTNREQETTAQMPQSVFVRRVGEIESLR